MMTMNVTVDQIRAARALLRLPQEEPAKVSWLDIRLILDSLRGLSSSLNRSRRQGAPKHRRIQQNHRPLGCGASGGPHHERPSFALSVMSLIPLPVLSSEDVPLRASLKRVTVRERWEQMTAGAAGLRASGATPCAVARAWNSVSGVGRREAKGLPSPSLLYFSFC